MSKSRRPSMVGIICNWCCYGGADLCGVSRFQYPSYIKLVRVMCSGRVDLKHILRAFLKGQDGVFVGGCWTGDCHYITEGNYDALSMIHLGKKILEHLGINPDRLRIEWVSAGEGIRFANLMHEFGGQMERLGPLGASEGIAREELMARLEKVVKLVPYIKIAKREKLALHIKGNDEEYSRLFTAEEIRQLFQEVPVYQIDADKCQGCSICAQRCPAEAISGDKKQVHVIDQDKCLKCGVCLAVCPPRFGSVTKSTGSVQIN